MVVSTVALMWSSSCETITFDANLVKSSRLGILYDDPHRTLPRLPFFRCGPSACEKRTKKQKRVEKKERSYVGGVMGSAAKLMLC